MAMSDPSTEEGYMSDPSTEEGYMSNRSNEEESMSDRNTKEESVSDRNTEEESVLDPSPKEESVLDPSPKEEFVFDPSFREESVFDPSFREEDESKASSREADVNTIHKEEADIKQNNVVLNIISTISRVAPDLTYNVRKANSIRKTRMMKKVCAEFRTMWNHATTLFSPIQKSRTSHTVPYPKVDWTSVNKRFLSNVPSPVSLPVHGCFQNPKDYENQYERSDYGTMMNNGSKFTNEFPFGSILGFHTDAGPIQVPDHVIHGHVYDAKQGWILHASYEERKSEQRNERPTRRTRRKG